MLKIGEFSKLSFTTIKTLRYYEKEKLLCPAYIDEFTGYRYYETAQLKELSKIISLRQIGLSIEDIKKIKTGESLEIFLEKRMRSLENELKTSNNQLNRIKLMLKNKESVSMKQEIVIKEVPEYIVFFKEGKLDKFEDIGDFIVKAGEEVAKSNENLKCIKPDYCFMEYLDDEHRTSNISCRYSQAVETYGNETNNIKFKKLPKITVAAIYHKGAYDNLGETYSVILKYIEDHGYKMIDHIRESYIDGIWNKENVEEWLTEIQVPIQK